MSKIKIKLNSMGNDYSLTITTHEVGIMCYGKASIASLEINFPHIHLYPTIFHK